MLACFICCMVYKIAIGITYLYLGNKCYMYTWYIWSLETQCSPKVTIQSPVPITFFKYWCHRENSHRKDVYCYIVNNRSTIHAAVDCRTLFILIPASRRLSRALRRRRQCRGLLKCRLVKTKSYAVRIQKLQCEYYCVYGHGWFNSNSDIIPNGDSGHSCCVYCLSVSFLKYKLMLKKLGQHLLEQLSTRKPITP